MYYWHNYLLPGHPLLLVGHPPFVLLFSRPNMVIKLLLQLLNHCSYLCFVHISRSGIPPGGSA